MTRKQKDELKQAEEQRQREREEKKALRQALFQQRLEAYREEIAEKTADELEASGPPVDPRLWGEYNRAIKEKRQSPA